MSHIDSLSRPLSHPLSRRAFITRAGVAAATLAMPRPVFAGNGTQWQRTVVLIELNGGNDGLNTVVPYRDPLYRDFRPTLALPHDQIAQLDENLGLHPALAPLMPHWQRQHMAIALGVGYPQPNLSHFQSIDIWETASADGDDDGWIARLFAKNPPPKTAAADGIILGRDRLGPLAGPRMRTLGMRKPKALRQVAMRDGDDRPTASWPALAHILKTRKQLRQSAAQIIEKRLDTLDLGTTFPKHGFGQQMQTAARLIIGGTGVPVIKCSLGSFDTHGNQKNTHARLLAQLATGVAAFAAAMEHAGRWDEVLLMTYGEFGRRPRENASGGTDHGTAAPHFVLGGRVRGGFQGEQPPLDRLEGNNLAYRLHFNRLYASIARDWWGLRGGAFDARPLDLIG